MPTFPIVPKDDKLLNIDHETMIDHISMEDVVEYLNEILFYYGPPCEFCSNFDVICSKGIRNRKYYLRIGPFTEWHIRKFCISHEGIDHSEDLDDENKRSVRNRLNCAAQQYG